MLQKLTDRFTQTPASLAPSSYRYFVASNYMLLIGLTSHLGFITIFSALGVAPLALFNLLSIATFCLALKLNLAGHLRAGYLLAHIEIIAHSILGVVLLGWEAGFQYYLLCALLSVIMFPWRAMALKYGHIVLLALTFALLDLYSDAAQPVLAVSEATRQFLNILNVAAMFVVISLIIFLYEAVATKAFTDTFARYVGPGVADRLMSDPRALQPGGDVQRVTILMSDLRGFSDLASRISPAKMVQLLNRYLDSMTEVIMAHDGMVNEFVGDAILAVFGAPEIHDDDALRAVRCGIAMQLALEELNREHRVEGVRDFEMGIGIHTGEVLLGNIGNERRAKYGVVGDTVNMTARIEGLTCGGQVLISHEGYASAGMSVEVKSAREVMFKGGADIMRIYSVVGVDGPEGKIALKEMESAQELRPSSIAAKAYPITGKGKSVSEHAVEVVITGVGQRLLAIECGSIEELDDVKIELDGRPLAAPIYGKIIDRDIASGLLRAAVPLDLEQIFAQDHGR